MADDYPVLPIIEAEQNFLNEMPSLSTKMKTDILTFPTLWGKGQNLRTFPLKQYMQLISRIPIPIMASVVDLMIDILFSFGLDKLS